MNMYTSYYKKQVEIINASKLSLFVYLFPINEQTHTKSSTQSVIQMSFDK